MKVSEVVNTYTVIKNMSQKKMPIKMSRILTRNMRKMESIVQDFDEDRNKLVEKYGERKEDGSLNYNENGGVKIMDDGFNELFEIMNMEVDITYDKLSEQDIERCDSDPGYDKLTKEEVDALEPMLEDGDVE